MNEEKKSNFIPRRLQRRVEDMVREALEPFDENDGLTPDERVVRYKGSATDASLAAAIAAALGAPVTASNVRSVRADLYGKLYLRGAAKEPSVTVTEAEFAAMRERLCALENLTQALQRRIKLLEVDVEVRSNINTTLFGEAS